jgi:DNA-binding GntR family transcriptional regulator
MPAPTKRKKTSVAVSKTRPLAPAKSLAERAADEIRLMITNGDLPSGEALSELALAGQLGVSKTPVREAFLRLRQEGLVEASPRRGTYVFEMDKEQVAQLSRFRFVLERAALDMLGPDSFAALAAEHAKILRSMADAIEDDDGPKYRLLDTQYHASIVRASGNEFMIESFNGVAWRVQAMLSRLLKDPRLNAISFDEHMRLTKHIKDGDIAAARTLLETHILDAQTRYSKLVADEVIEL